MTPLALLLSSLLAAAPGTRAAPRNAGAGGRATVEVDGDVARIKQPRRGGRALDVELSFGASCPAKKLSRVLAREVRQNGSAFGGRQAMQIQIARNGRARRAFEQGVAKILGRGEQRGGFTDMPGFEVPFGRLPGPGGTKSVDVPGGSSTVTGLPGGGFEVTTERTGPGGFSDNSTVILGADGASSVLRSFGLRGRIGTVEITSSEDRDADGNKKGGGFSMNGQGGLMDGGVGGSTTPQPSGGGGGGGSSDPPQSPEPAPEPEPEPTPSDGEHGSTDQAGQSPNPSNSPGMTSDDTFVMPPLRLDNVVIAEVINWNRLGGAVTQPSPIGGGDDAGVDTTHIGGNDGPCGALKDRGFDPNPNYLMPNKQGQVTDPLPTLGKS